MSMTQRTSASCFSPTWMVCEDMGTYGLTCTQPAAPIAHSTTKRAFFTRPSPLLHPRAGRRLPGGRLAAHDRVFTELDPNHVALDLALPHEVRPEDEAQRAHAVEPDATALELDHLADGRLRRAALRLAVEERAARRLPPELHGEGAAREPHALAHVVPAPVRLHGEGPAPDGSAVRELGDAAQRGLALEL